MNNPEHFIKKLIYKSMHRGSKEMDILLGETFSFIKKMTYEECEIYDQFLNEEDHDIFNWIMIKENFPQNYAFIAALFAELFPKKSL